MVLSVSSSSWCLERAAVCDCGTPWTFLLPFLGLRLKRICSKDKSYEEQKDVLRSQLIRRGYIEGMIKREFKKVDKVERGEAIRGRIQRSKMIESRWLSLTQAIYQIFTV